MSYELRTPLNAIVGFTRIVQRRTRVLIPEKQSENLEKVLISAEHLLALINDTLDLSKVEAGRIEVQPTRFQLPPLIDLCVETVEPLVKSDRLRLSKRMESDLPALFTDQERLKQILINLLSNAVKFTESGSVTVTARLAEDERRKTKDGISPTPRDSSSVLRPPSSVWSLPSSEAKGPPSGERVEIAVSDTGIGIPVDKLEAIFEEFRQVDSSTTRPHGGTGLGLSISRHLARLMGGDIAVASALGEGSTFTVTLPVRYRPAPANGAPPAPTTVAPPVSDHRAASPGAAQVANAGPPGAEAPGYPYEGR